VCAALEAEDGQTNRERYKAWFGQWVEHKYPRVLSAASSTAFAAGLRIRASRPRAKIGQVQELQVLVVWRGGIDARR
jgi:hypothetical protein